MPTTTGRKKQRGRAAESAAPPTAPPDPPTKRNSRRWLLLGLFGVAIIVVWLIPAIVAHSPILNRIVAVSTKQLHGKVTVRSASLGWLSPPTVSGVELHDEEDQPLLEVPHAAGDRSLLSMLCNWSQLGRIRIERPTLHLVLRDDGSNLEDVLADLLRPSDREPARVNLHLEIIDGTVSIQHPRAQTSWQIEPLQLALDLPAERSRSLELQTSGVVLGQTPGRFAVGLKVNPGAPSEDGPPPPGEANLNTENLPLEMFTPLAGRFAPGVEMAGRLSSAIQCRFQGRAALETLSVEGTATTENLVLAAPPLGTDRLALARLEAACRLAYQDGRLEIDRLATQSDVGNVSLAGTLRLGETPADELLKCLPRQTYQVDAKIDLARLAGLLPNTLRIRDQTRFASGQLEVALASRRQPEGMVWQGRIHATNLTAVNQGRRLVWEQPILITLAAHQTPQGPVVENLRCESSFLKVHGSGTPDNMTAQAHFDLNQLAVQLSQFVDLGGFRLAGDGRANLSWSRAADHRFQADGELELEDFQFTPGGRRPWNEPHLAATFSASGRTDFRSDSRLDAAVLEVVAGEDPPDRLHLQLVQPVVDFRDAAWPVEVRSQGQLARWLPRISPWVHLDEWQWAGAYELTGDVQFRQASEQITGTVDAVVDDLVVTHQAGHRFQQKQVRLAARGSYHTQARLLHLEEAALRSGPVAATAAGRVTAQGERLELEIDARVDYDMEQLSELLRSYFGEGVYLTGRGTSPVSFRGPLALDGAQAGTAVRWSWGEVYGFRLGPGELQAALAEGVVHVEPATLEVSEGRVHLSPQLRLDPKPIELTVPPGPLVENVRINPRMCAHGLKYIAPALAGVATAEGRFSIELDGCRIRLADPAACELAGRMTIHSAQIGPGPLVRELALALGYTSPAQLAQQSTIEFRMVEGRVYHRGLELVFPDLVIRTYGWVGLDKSLGVMAEMPVPPKWLGAHRVLDSALRNQTIQLPIGGSLERPKIDRRALGEVSRQFLENAAANVLEDELIRGLDRLFGQPR